MRKRTILAMSISAIALLTAGGIVYAVTRPTATPHLWAKAKSTRATVACLTANSSLTIQKDTRSYIEMSALSYLSDVPAGTKVDVNLATYSPTKVTGSNHYPGKYGTYNFTMTNTGDGWRFTDFKHCY